jgi:hypothetical protein
LQTIISYLLHVGNLIVVDKGPVLLHLPPVMSAVSTPPDLRYRSGVGIVLATFLTTTRSGVYSFWRLFDHYSFWRLANGKRAFKSALTALI